MKPSRECLHAFILAATASVGCSRKEQPAAPTETQDSAADVVSDSVAPDVVSPTAWIVPPQAPKECRIRVSTSPKDDPGPLKWRSCSDVKNCRQSTVDWSEGGGATLAVRLYEPVKLVNGRPTLAYSRRLTKKGSIELDGYIDIVEELGGDPKFALRQLRSDDTWCGAWTSVGDWGVVSWLSVAGAKGVFVGALAAGANSSTMRFGLLANEQLMVLPPEGGPQFASVGPANYFLETVSPSSIVVVDPTAIAVRPRPAPLPLAVAPRSYNDGALAYAADGSGGWGFMTATGEFARWRASPGHETTALSIDRQRSGAIVWVESATSTGGFTEPTMYVSPPARNAGELAPLKISTLRDDLEMGAAGLVANDGLALSIASYATAIVTDLKTGARTELTAPGDAAFVLPLWVSAGEAWLLTGKSGISNPQLATNSIIRIGF